MIETNAVKTAVTTTRLRLDYLDGMRGLAALYVVMYHASDASWAGGSCLTSFRPVSS